MGSSCLVKKDRTMASSSRIEHRLVTSVRNEHRHGLRMFNRWCCLCSTAPSALSLLGTGSSSECLSRLGLAIAVCTYCDLDSADAVLLVSRLALRSGGLSECAGRALFAGSFIVAESLLLSPFSVPLAFADPSSSSAEPDGRLLIERGARQTRPHPASAVVTVRGGVSGECGAMGGCLSGGAFFAKERLGGRAAVG